MLLIYLYAQKSKYLKTKEKKRQKMKKTKEAKTTTIILNVNDELFLLESEVELTKDQKEYLEDMAYYFYSEDEWGDEEQEHRLTLSDSEVAGLIVDMANDVYKTKISFKKIDLELYVSE